MARPQFTADVPVVRVVLQGTSVPKNHGFHRTGICGDSRPDCVRRIDTKKNQL